ncbi:MAG: TolC family protein [bacterium]
MRTTTNPLELNLFRLWSAVLVVTVCLCGLMPAFSAFAQDNHGVVLSLQQCETLAFENNPLLEDARQSLRLAEVKMLQVMHSNILPRFELRNVWGPIPQQRGVYDSTGVLTSPDKPDEFNELRYFTQVDLHLEQPLYTFGRYSKRSQEAHFSAQAARARVEKRKAETQLQVRQLYWGLVLGQELLPVIVKARDDMTKAENKLEEKLEAGSDEVSQTDLFKLQMFKYEINKRHREALYKLGLARSSLKAAIGLPQQDEFTLETEYLEPLQVELDSLSIYYDLALRNRPELAELRAKTNARYARIEVERSQRYPQFFAGAETKFNFAKDRFDPRNPFVNNSTNYFRPNPFVGVRQNLNFVRTLDKIRLAQIEYELAGQKDQALAKEILLQVKKAYAQVLQARTRLEQSRKALKASDNWLRSASMTFDIGVGETKNLIKASRANSAMQAEHFQNIFLLNTALAELSRVVGKDVYPEVGR